MDMKNAKTYSREEALHLAAAWCSGTERCCFDVREKLSGWETDAETAEEILEYLIMERFIDERRYACAYVKDKFRYNQWGKIKIRYMLNMKKIPSDIISEALEMLDEETYKEMIIKLIQQKSKGLKAANDYERKGKLSRFLTGKGFEYEAFADLLG
jgi:regulatory protein